MGIAILPEELREIESVVVELHFNRVMFRNCVCKYIYITSTVCSVGVAKLVNEELC